MEDYELTDRGKIVITIVLVVLLLFLPAAILLYTAMAGQPSQTPENPGSQALVTTENPDPSITESPPPNGGGFNPGDASPQDVGEVETQKPPPLFLQTPPKPTGSGQGIVNAIEGTLSFNFSPDVHSALSTETSLLLDAFLISPKNKPDSIVAVESPQLELKDSEKLVSVVNSALSTRGVPLNRIEYIMNETVPEADFFEVSMSYTTRLPK